LGLLNVGNEFRQVFKRWLAIQAPYRHGLSNFCAMLQVSLRDGFLGK
jgi:hypothetical protein